MRNIILIGPHGAGKTTIGKIVAKGLGRDFIDSDQFVVERSGVSKAWIFDVEGEEGFRQRETNAIKELMKLKNIVLSTGSGAILKEENRAVLKKSGLIIYLKVSIAQQMNRTRRDDEKRPLLCTKDLKKRLEELQEQRQGFYNELADMSFDTDKQSTRVVANQIIRALQSAWAQNNDSSI